MKSQLELEAVIGHLGKLASYDSYSYNNYRNSLNTSEEESF